MQDQVVEWDPIYGGTGVPWESQLFLLYLAVALVLSIFKSITIIRQLWWFSSNLRASSNQVRAASEPADSTGHTVLAAESKFQYEADTCATKIRSIKHLVPLTILMSLLVLIRSAIRILTGIGAEKRTSLNFLSGVIGEALIPFALALLVCGIILGISNLYEGILARQKARWRYSCDQVKQQSQSAV